MCSKKSSYLRVCLGTQSRRHKLSIADTPASKQTLRELDFELLASVVWQFRWNSTLQRRCANTHHIGPHISGTSSSYQCSPESCGLWAAQQDSWHFWMNQHLPFSNQKNIQLESQSSCASQKKKILRIYQIYCASLLINKIISFPPNHRIFQH